MGTGSSPGYSTCNPATESETVRDLHLKRPTKGPLYFSSYAQIRNPEGIRRALLSRIDEKITRNQETPETFTSALF